jgi:hypothetical protein
MSLSFESAPILPFPLLANKGKPLQATKREERLR